MFSDEEKIYLQKICSFCAYRERATIEIEEKFKEWELPQSSREKLLAFLIEENFFDEMRFATFYALGKLRNNQWGKNKIYTGLKERRVQAKAIYHGLSVIEDEEYFEVLDHILAKKIKLTKSKNPFDLRKKVANYLLQKGFESHLIWGRISEKIPIKY